MPDRRIVQMGSQLRALRARLGWSLRYAAARLGMFEDHLRSLEGGEPMPIERWWRINRVYTRTLTKLGEKRHVRYR